MMNNITIDLMNLNDFYSIKDIFKSSFDEFWNVNILKEELENPSSKFIVAKYKNEIVGFAGFKILVDCADIMNIAVKKDFRSKGIGSLLLKSLIDLYSSLNLNSLNLEVNENNIHAINLYKKFRFKEISVRKNYYPNSENAIIMQLTN